MSFWACSAPHFCRAVCGSPKAFDAVKAWGEVPPQPHASSDADVPKQEASRAADAARRATQMGSKVPDLSPGSAKRLS